ncbi:MAG: molybdenum ABC transporter ATP-binding protein [Paracoccaceae bacterium]
MLHLDISLPLPDFALTLRHDFAPEGVTAIFGPSGAGKSTLLRVIAGLDRRATGRIAMGEDIWQDATRFTTPEHRGTGYVFQDTRLFPHLTVQGNLDYAATRAKGLGGPATADVIKALDLAPLLTRRTTALSGGEKQRTAIARALLTAPRILLMDEPLASLDETRKAEILPYLERLRDLGGTPILYVSHSVAEVSRLADHILVLQNGQIKRTGPATDLMSDPEAVPLFGIREAGAILPARMAAQEDDGLSRLSTSAGPLLLPRIEATIGATLRIRILAQDVILSRVRPTGLSALNILPATVTTLRMGDGPGALVQLKAGDDLLLARITGRSALALDLQPGTPVYAILKSVAVARGQIGSRAD